MWDRFLRACRREPVDATPVWFMRQAGRYMEEYRALRKKHTLIELCKSPELATEVTLQPVKALGVDAAILFADILLILEPLGAPFEFAAGEGPVIRARRRARLRARRGAPDPQRAGRQNTADRFCGRPLHARKLPD
jgi:uroporphyrinogen decarboxylase